MLHTNITLSGSPTIEGGSFEHSCSGVENDTGNGMSASRACCKLRKEGKSCEEDTVPIEDAQASYSHKHTQSVICCGHDQSLVVPVDFSTIMKSSSTCAVYRIVNMDCPMEESLIRKKLKGTQGIDSLEFNLMQRILTVHHHLPSTLGIEAALKSIDMTPEAIEETDGALAVFSIVGMDCPTEEGLIKNKLSGMNGVFDLKFNLIQRRLEVHHDPAALPAISKALASLDLGAILLEGEVIQNTTSPSTAIAWKRLLLAGVFAAASEMFELMKEWDVKPFGVDLSFFTIENIQIIDWLPLFFAAIAILLGGLVTYKKGWIAIKNFNLNINALMSVAVTGAVLIGQYPEAAMVMVLFNLAEAIESKSLDHARNAIQGLLSLTPEKATILQPDDNWLEVDVRLIPVGSKVRVRPGEKIALDGTITAGRSTINQASITGESLPVEKTIGDIVYAGTLNESGSFEFTVTAGATNSTLSKIIHAVEQAQGVRAPMQRFVDQFAKYYTPAVFVVALLVATIPPLFMESLWVTSIYTALVILVIGCPCALVISTPVSIVSGMAAATRHGILIKGGVFLEQGRLLRWLAVDKTGTITHGKPIQTNFISVGNIDEQTVIAIASSLASRSDHPVSRAIAKNAESSQKFAVKDFTALLGQGVCGVINGQTWYLGNHSMIEEYSLCSVALEEIIIAFEKEGKSVVALLNSDGVEAIFAVADTLKETSIEAMAELKKLGVKTIMLTGDNEHTARTIATEVGVDEFRGGLLPADKLAMVEILEQEGKVGMVGDGINDAPALARADIGFAMAAAGTDTAIETADVALMDDDLRKIPRFIKLSRSTYAILVQNIVLALGVKAIFLTLAFMGEATMWMAVFADVGTSILVVINGLRLLKK